MKTEGDRVKGSSRSSFNNQNRFNRSNTASLGFKESSFQKRDLEQIENENSSVVAKPTSALPEKLSLDKRRSSIKHGKTMVAKKHQVESFELSPDD